MPNHHRENEWDKTLIDLKLNIQYDDVKKRDEVIENWKKTWKFAINNNINHKLELLNGGGFALEHIGALYRDWKAWSWSNEKERRKKDKITKEFDNLLYITIRGLEYLNYHDFLEDIDDYEQRMRITIIKMIDNHYEPKRKRIRKTICDMTPAGVSCCNEIIWSYMFLPYLLEPY